MALIVPNATATGSSNKYVNINQAEPDSVDFESLGNTLNYIRSGGVVTVGGSNLISITAGVAVIGGIPYSFSSSSFIGATTADARFDLIVVRLSGASAVVTLITGTENATNPTLPQSTSTLSTTPSLLFNYYPNTDALLASIFTLPSTDLLASNIVDKRVISTAPVTYTGTGIPTSSTKDVIGDTVIFGGDSYIKNTSSTWAKLTTTVEVEAAKIPIGGMFAFAGTHNTASVPSPSVYLECTGAGISKLAYTALWNVIGYSFPNPANNVYPTTGDTFYLPNMVADNGLVGASTAELSGSGRTASSVNTMPVILPSHQHTYTTTIGDKTGSTTVGSKSGNVTTATSLTGSVTGTSHSHFTRTGQESTIEYYTIRKSTFSGTAPHYEASYINGGYAGGMVVQSNSSDSVTGDSSTGGTATITIPTSLGVTTNIGVVSITTSIGNPTGTTDLFGTVGATMSILSKSTRVRWFIRYA